MPDFFSLSASERKDIIITVSQRIGLSPIILEKDLWIVWALDKLFTMPEKLQMAFKGGTSLSKIYNMIERFSEDLDITIDYKSFAVDEDPFDKNLSKSKIKKLSEKIKHEVNNYILNIVYPYFNEMCAKEFTNKKIELYIEDGEKLYIEYPSVLDRVSSGYIKSRVLIEFGGRNVISPSNLHNVETYLCKHVNNIDFPVAQVQVLSPKRTFWEKATLIHVACNRGKDNFGRGHQFRHWYDLVMMYSHDACNNAVAEQELLTDVIKLKSVFFNASYAHYNDCLEKKLRLVPDNDMLKTLHSDYQAMVDEGMFFDKPPTFDEIMSRVNEIERTFNTS